MTIPAATTDGPSVQGDEDVPDPPGGWVEAAPYVPPEDAQSPVAAPVIAGENQILTVDPTIKQGNRLRPLT